MQARIAQLPRPLVFTNGVFDILHRGHVSYLAQARALVSLKTHFLDMHFDKDPTHLIPKLPEGCQTFPDNDRIFFEKTIQPGDEVLAKYLAQDEREKFLAMVAFVEAHPNCGWRMRVVKWCNCDDNHCLWVVLCGNAESCSYCTH